MNNPAAVLRIRILSAGIFLFALVLAGKLYAVQIIDGGFWAEKADRQYARSDTTLFDRGTIYFTSKDGTTVSAATLKTGFTLAVDPQRVENAGALYEKVRPFITLSRDEFIQKATREGARYVEIATQVPSEVALQVEALSEGSIIVAKNRWRFYPGGSLAAHSLGFLAYKGDEYAGRYGLERYYEEILARNRGEEYVNFFAEIFSNIKDTVANGGPLEGDVVTTIEPVVQGMLEEKIAEINDTWSSKFTGGVIMDPKTGEIYALALHPAFDLNNFSDVTDIARFSNPMVENVYEMGSIIKPLTMAAGLDSGAVTARTTYNDAGCMTLNSARFCNYDGEARGVVSMQEVLKQSLNTGVTFVVQQMGKNQFADYMKNFGIGVETGIDLPNETHGLIKNLESPREIEYATASFGQGVAITPIATVRALSALGNGGVLPSPHLVKEIRYRVGGTKEVSYPPGKQVIKPETSEEISRMLTEVVDKALLGGTIAMEGYSIAAKTGTAQIANPNGGGYYDDRYLHSFFGYFPSYDPKFIVFLFTVEPVGVRYASETLAVPFGDITKYLIGYYAIPPDRGKTSLE
ncbi:MAG: hypothetical protein COV34_02305 [Candidatus Zambryskibacteria bacterium CG10_big_fil_rev_8_21_14_0_10_42_12]|uniref:Uncharacterized protein n=1 Tax=Candidatus Zambryskibacteria bacterium CG10_big_fil_rev_8_21_14_0_10_42_12 TaxID=1975115 RepID=A0A2H0QUD7_9BACT|nr:MAG: hypothetical protein COV34_02305 [Candidatus Zambryskibacteria bacterium CG10_big_fil_rev_8_21_14_0_10_42_12]